MDGTKQIVEVTASQESGKYYEYINCTEIEKSCRSLLQIMTNGVRPCIYHLRSIPNNRSSKSILTKSAAKS